MMQVLIVLVLGLTTVFGDTLDQIEKQQHLREHLFSGIGPVLDSKQTNWELVFDEDFRAASLDPDHWNIEEGDGCNKKICGWGNGEIQSYTRSAISTSDGRLTITATQNRRITPAEREKNKKFWLRTKDDYVTTWQSGRINSKNKVQGRYGLISFSARLPTGQGVWPALWLLPTNDSVPWPIGGEIDVVEYNHFWAPWTTPSTLHYAQPGIENGAYTTFNGTYGPNAGLNEYSVLWTPEAITFIRDGMSIGTYPRKDNIWPFDDNAFHLVLNVAISPFWGELPDDQTTSFRLDVDTIRWWQRKSYKKWNNVQTRKMGVIVPGLPDFL